MEETNISQLAVSQVLGHHPAVLLPCTLLLLVGIPSPKSPLPTTPYAKEMRSRVFATTPDS